MRRMTTALIVLTLAACSAGDAPTAVNSDSETAAVAAGADSSDRVAAEPAPDQPKVVYQPLAFDIARYPGAKQLGDAPDYFAEDHKARNSRWLQFESADAPEKVIAFYKAEAEEAGFTLTEETEQELLKSRQIKAERPQGGLLKVNTMVQKDGNTFINVHTSQDK